MFKYMIKAILAGITVKLMDNWRRLSIQLLKIEAAKFYLHGVRMARWSAINLLWIGLAIGLIGVGTLLFHAALFLLLPWTVETKALLGLLMGLAYVGIGYAVLHESVNEKTWLEKSGVSELLKEATDQSKKTGQPAR